MDWIPVIALIAAYIAYLLWRVDRAMGEVTKLLNAQRNLAMEQRDQLKRIGDFVDAADLRQKLQDFK